MATLGTYVVLSNNVELNEDELYYIRRENSKKARELLDAAGENNIEKVKELLCYEDKSSEKINFRKHYVNEKSLNDWIALHAAAEAGLTDIAQLLIDCGSKIDALSEVLYTPLHLAASGGYVKLVELLLTNGADTQIVTEAGLNGTALHYAAGKGHYEVIRLLTGAKHGEDLVNDLSSDNCTALYYAVLGGHIDIVNLLLERGGKQTINSTDDDGLSALHNAALCGFMEITKCLVEDGGADVRLKDWKFRVGRTPSDLAKEMANKDVMKYLNEKMNE